MMSGSVHQSEKRLALQNARILIVEDDPGVTHLLTHILRAGGYTQVLATSDARIVGALYTEYRPDLILLDLHLPHRSGQEVLEELEETTRGNTFLPILVLTGDSTREARQRALSSGAKDFLGKPFDPLEVLLRIENLLEMRFLYCRLQERNETLTLTVQTRTEELRAAQEEILERLTQAVECHDDSTGQHTRRVGESSARIASALGLPAHEVEVIRRAAPLHDVGKVAIPDVILRKSGPLTPAEFEVMKTHTTIGARMLAGGSSELLRMAQQIALSHHERWNGSGYPQGLREEEIPLAARIVALADFCDALAYDRPYRKAWPRERVEEEINRQAGQHFDPAVVAAYFRAEGSMALAHLEC